MGIGLKIKSQLPSSLLFLTPSNCIWLLHFSVLFVHQGKELCLSPSPALLDFVDVFKLQHTRLVLASQCSNGLFLSLTFLKQFEGFHKAPEAFSFVASSNPIYISLIHRGKVSIYSRLQRCLKCSEQDQQTLFTLCIRHRGNLAFQSPR